MPQSQKLPKPSTRVLSLYPTKKTKKGIKGDGTVIYQDLSRTLSSYLFGGFPIVFNSPSICLQRPKPPTTLDTKSWCDILRRLGSCGTDKNRATVRPWICSFIRFHETWWDFLFIRPNESQEHPTMTVAFYIIPNNYVYPIWFCWWTHYLWNQSHMFKT